MSFIRLLNAGYYPQKNGRTKKVISLTDT